MKKSDPFEYHTFLHHSQTDGTVTMNLPEFEYHTFLHHSQTTGTVREHIDQFEYHTFLHHSQTDIFHPSFNKSLSTIHFYIILKPQIQK